MAHSEHALSFGQVASLYDSIRPTYPVEAVSWALGSGAAPGRGVAVDLGAGTGLLTRVVASLAGRVIAVEPDPDMRCRLEASVPGIATLAGTAESIPLPDATVDSVVCGQAYHWFDQDLAHPEIARVLRPGGTFAALWNLRDAGVPWVAAVDAAAGDAPRGHVRDPRQRVDHNYGPLFETVQYATFRHEMPMDAARLVALIASRSSYIVADKVTQTRIESAIRAIAASLPPTFAMPYVTACYRATRR